MRWLEGVCVGMWEGRGVRGEWDGVVVDGRESCGVAASPLEHMALARTLRHC